MNIGQYFIDAGTIIGLLFKSAQMQQISAFLLSVGGALVAGSGSIPPITIGDDVLNISITKKA